MFARAYDIVKNFTRPVVVSTRLENGTVTCGLGTFMFVNRDGWAVTAAHILSAAMALNQHQQERLAYNQAVDAIKNDTSLSVKQRNRQLEKIKPNPNWITNQSLWWCQDGATVSQAYADIAADVVILKLDNIDLAGIAGFPVFKRTTADPPPGKSFCRLGFPFVEVKALFDAATNNFMMQNFSLPPMFPNDGIHTRTAVDTDPKTNRTVRFIETSTPGLMGQSGGPLFDVDGVVWGVQSRTNFLDLGFSPKKQGSTAYQFMNVGLASHIQHAIALLDQYGVRYDSVP